jgi:hypothetical protein
MAVIDDFHTAPNRAVDLDRLHQWTGKMPITAARKFQGEVAFIYYGALMMMCNKMWKTSTAPQVADERRFTGQFYQVCFKDRPDPSKNERKKDKRIKETLHEHVPEFIFWVLAMYKIRQANEASENTKPYPPSTVLMRREFMSRCQGLDEVVRVYIETKLIAYTPSKKEPASINAVVDDIINYARDEHQLTCQEEDVRTNLKSATGILLKQGWSYQIPGVPGPKGKRSARVVRRATSQRDARMEPIYETLTIRPKE